MYRRWWSDLPRRVLLEGGDCQSCRPRRTQLSADHCVLPGPQRLWGDGGDATSRRDGQTVDGQTVDKQTVDRQTLDEETDRQLVKTALQRKIPRSERWNLNRASSYIFLSFLFSFVLSSFLSLCVGPAGCFRDTGAVWPGCMKGPEPTVVTRWGRKSGERTDTHHWPVSRATLHKRRTEINSTKKSQHKRML